jgi:peptidoglycan/xylan/chitin deacetylase (PgdA/CDA1 family)
MNAVRSLSKNCLQYGLFRRSFLWRLPTGKAAALTFDDGPDPDRTPRILEVLARHAVKATFFVVGERVRRYPGVLSQVIAEGHAVASHTDTHQVMTEIDSDTLSQELAACRKSIADVTGIDTMLVRPPKGRLDLRSLRRAGALGYRIVHWSVTYSDYLNDGVDPLYRRMQARAPGARDIVLMHDNLEHTPAALARALPEWLGEGRSFVSL